MTEGSNLVLALAKPMEHSRGEADGGAHIPSAADRINLSVLRGVLSSLGGPNSPGSGGGKKMNRISSQSMGVMSRGVYGTLGLGDISDWGKSASVGANGRPQEEKLGRGVQSDTVRRKQCSVPASPTSVHGFKDDHVAIDMSVLEQSMILNLPSVTCEQIRTPGPPKVSSKKVLDEFPNLNLKPIRTRTPINKLPTVHVTNSKPSDFKDSVHGGLVQYGVCFGGGVWRMFAQVGTAMGACVAAVMYVIGME